MQHPDVPRRDNVRERACLDVSNLDEAGLEREDVRVGQRKRRRLTLPADLPLRTRAPAVPVHEEGKVRVVEQEVAVQALDVYRLDVFPSRDKVQRRVGLVEQRLRLQGLEADHLKALGAADAELGLQEMDRRRFRGYIYLLVERRSGQPPRS